MNSLYNLALRQSASLTTDLATLQTNPSAALHGQIAASLAALGRTVDDYEAMARRELVPAKREKALMRVAKFREEEKSARQELNAAKNRQPQASTSSLSIGATGNAASAGGASLRSPISPAESPYSLHARPAATPSAYNGTSTPTYAVPSSTPSPAPYGGNSHDPYAQPPHAHSYTSGAGVHSDPLAAYRQNAQSLYAQQGAGGYSAREHQALREHSFIGGAEAQLDTMIAQGRAAWGNLSEQRDVLKGVQRKLRNVGVTMGLSRDVISYIERRTTQDNIIFVGGCIFTLVCFFFIYKWFG